MSYNLTWKRAKSKTKKQQTIMVITTRSPPHDQMNAALTKEPPYLIPETIIQSK